MNAPPQRATTRLQKKDVAEGAEALSRLQSDALDKGNQNISPAPATSLRAGNVSARYLAIGPRRL